MDGSPHPTYRKLTYPLLALAILCCAATGHAAAPGAPSSTELLALLPAESAADCSALAELWRQEGGDRGELECRTLPADAVSDSQPAEMETQHPPLRATLWPRANGWYALWTASHSAAGVDHDWRWQLRPDPRHSLADLLQRALAPMAADGRGAAQALSPATLEGCTQSNRLRLRFDGGIEERAAPGAWLTPPAIREALAEETAELRNGTRTTLFLGGTLTLFTLAYQLTRDVQDEDWDYTWEPETRFKTSEHWKLDTNSRWLNWGHTLAGIPYHQIPRSNGFGFWGSYGFNALASSWWEMVIEYKEVISINDQVQTIIGGSVIGESLYQIGDLLDTSRGSFGTRTVAALSRPFDPLSRWLDDKDWLNGSPPRPQLRPARQRLDDFHFSYGVRNLRPEGAGPTTVGTLGMHANVLQPRVESAGRGGRMYWRPAITELDLVVEVGNGDDGYLSGVHFDNRLALMGFHYKDIRRSNAGPRGYSLFIGPLQGVEWRNREYDRHEDWYGIINTIGGIVDGTVHLGDSSLLRLTTDLTADFAMIQPYALNKYDRDHSIQRGKLVLRQERYLYGWGPSLRVRADARLGRRVRLGGAWRESSYDSVDRRKWERFPKAVSDDTCTEDVIRSLQATAAVCLTRRCDPSQLHYSGSSIWELELGYESLYRRGVMYRNSDHSQRATDSSREHRLHLGLNAKY